MKRVKRIQSNVTHGNVAKISGYVTLHTPLHCLPPKSFKWLERRGPGWLVLSPPPPFLRGGAKQQRNHQKTGRKKESEKHGVWTTRP